MYVFNLHLPMIIEFPSLWQMDYLKTKIKTNHVNGKDDFLFLMHLYSIVKH